MNCPSCGAPMRLAAGNASLRCDYCKTVVIVQADDAGICFIDEDSADLNCPVCSLPLWNATLAGAQFHACKRCRGILIGMGVFASFIDRVRAASPDRQLPSPPDSDDLRRNIACPKCRQRMDVHFYLGGGGAVMGSCEPCELNWLDGGTLMRIVRAPQDESETQSW